MISLQDLNNLTPSSPFGSVLFIDFSFFQNFRELNTLNFSQQNQFRFSGLINTQGSFPLNSFANNSKLKVLALPMNSNNFQVDTEGNGFDGGVSTSFGNMSNLEILDLSRNHFSGEIPKSLWRGCSSLRYLVLSGNKLWGQPFSSPLNLSSLHWLFLDNNYLNGTLEHGIHNFLD
ncbi:receptor-like protein 15 [Senna tora]|uniref:Receptor-like protein 15 n=1 Tax=Senna tora TaxID=362788 RepID=A0A834T4G6_9FABA|nr:receptor-like protein 15 [Senna tora]